MKHVLVALLLVGCVGGKQLPTHPIPPKTDAAIAKTLNTASQTLDAVSGVVQLLCSDDGEGTDVCVSMSHSLAMVAFAVSEAKKLYETYQQTGLGVDLVHAAVDRVNATLARFYENAVMARMDRYGIDAPIASAYCTRCCGVVVEPKANAAAKTPTSAEANPYLKPVPAPKAP